MRGTLLLAAAIAGAAPAVAASVAAPGAAAPLDADEADRALWRGVFAAIRAGDLVGAAATIDANPSSMLAPVARAELWLAKGAPAIDGATVAAFVATAPDLPQASALAQLARARGAGSTTLLPAEQAVVRYAGASKRQVARPMRADATLSAVLTPLLKANDGADAEPLVEAAADRLSPAALAEWRERTAWAYYLADDDAGARRVAALARAGEGEWAVQADWVAGLAAWRMADMAAAAESFAAVAARARDPEMVAAGLYWGGRAEAAGARPDRAAPQWRSAARMGETFYGMLAAAALGLPDEAPAVDPAEARLLARPNARAATALAAIDERALADTLLRHEARIGDPAEHGALIRLAERLRLPATQVWLATNGPVGGASSSAARFPAPAWSPSGGWRVDRALLMAHALQESQFRADAVSPAGARGLMQLMPATARLVARHKGEPSDGADRLADPAVSFEYGQSYLEELAQNGGTGGLLPKVIAAYNAGPNNVAAWNLRSSVASDPLLFIESIPFAETRAYVAIVLRNYWMYQRGAGVASASLADLAAGRWPRFPTLAVDPPRTARAGVTAGTAGAGGQ